MRVISVGLLENEAANVVVLQEKGGKRLLVIAIGLAEAAAIALPVEGIDPPRPLTHDLVMSLLQRLRARIAGVVIHDLRDDTYIGQIDLETSNGIMEIDARSSDAIALAVRARAPIYATEDVLATAALTAEEDHWVR